MGRNEGTGPDPERGGRGARLLFMDRDDITDTRGKLRIGANSLQHVDRARGLPAGVTIREVARESDDAYAVYGYRAAHNVKDASWRIVRVRTRDGLVYDDVETVYTSERGHWYGSTEIVHNPSDGSFLCLKWGPGGKGRGHAMWAFGSADGSDWRPLSDRPVYHDHDAFSAAWDPQTEQYVVFQATYQTWEKKPYKDNAGRTVRRVLHFRTSRDGARWTPSGDITLRGEHAPDDAVLTPDEDDPPELEFYRLTAFPYEGRYVGMMLNYMPGPKCITGGGHGPHNGGEWWVSRNYRDWRRPFRDVFAPGPASNIVMHPPMDLGGLHLWVIGQEVYGLPQRRIFYVGSRSNCEFSTPLFEVPAAELLLDAEFAPEGRGFQGQSYIMAEALDEDGNVIEEFEKENCVLRRMDAPHRLRWGYPHALGAYSLARHTGRKVRLRFYLRDAKVYAVTSGQV